MDIHAFEKKPWWSYLEANQQRLLIQSAVLLNEEQAKPAVRFKDYSFIVFPAAKAYEGFLKKLFLDLGFITKKQYAGKYFRVGKALNPSLPKHLRKDWVHDKLEKFCQGSDHEALANILWQTWKKARNLLFHWFPGYKNAISLKEAEERVGMITNAMDEAVKGCFFAVK